jgi:hypothetical protein
MTIPPTRQAPPRIPGELDADYRARAKGRKRSMKWVGKGTWRHRKVFRDYGHRPIADQNASRVIGVTIISNATDEHAG